jgi:4-aminobutyrate aminotransferase-like enzyme
MAAIVAYCMAQGAIVGSNTNTVPGFSNVLIIAPPLVLTPGDADVLVAILKQALDTQL